MEKSLDVVQFLKRCVVSLGRKERITDSTRQGFDAFVTFAHNEFFRDFKFLVGTAFGGCHGRPLSFKYFFILFVRSVYRRSFGVRVGYNVVIPIQIDGLLFNFGQIQRQMCIRDGVIVSCFDNLLIADMVVPPIKGAERFATNGANNVVSIGGITVDLT
eukprot:scaffold3289_cov163-Amphora_coffeaeformis.AAC.10